MMKPSDMKLLGLVPFVAVNLAIALLLAFLVVVPVVDHFAGRNEEIAANAAQLAQLRKANRAAVELVKSRQHSTNLFLPGSEERLASADLQASLQAMAAGTQVRLLGSRSAPSPRASQLHLVAASIEVEGAPAHVKEFVAAIEGQTPLLFVTSFALRSLVNGEDNTMRAELTVAGAMRDGKSRPGIDGERNANVSPDGAKDGKL